MKKRGFIGKIILIIIALVLILGFFNVDIKSVVESPQVQKNTAYVVGFGKIIWDKYLSKPILYFWQNIFIDVLWEAFIKKINIGEFKMDQPVNLQFDAPIVPNPALDKIMSENEQTPI